MNAMKVKWKDFLKCFVPPPVGPITLEDAKLIGTGAISAVTVFAAIAYAAGIFAVHSWLSVYHLQTDSFARIGYLLSGIWVLYPVAIAIFGMSTVSRAWPLAIVATFVAAFLLLFWIYTADLDRYVNMFLRFTAVLLALGWMAGGMSRCFLGRSRAGVGVTVFSATAIIFVLSLAFWGEFLEKLPSSLGGKMPRQIRIWHSSEPIFEGDTDALHGYYRLALEDDDYFYISKGPESDTSIAIRKDVVQVAEFVVPRAKTVSDSETQSRAGEDAVSEDTLSSLKWLDVAGKYSLMIGAMAACATAGIAWYQFARGRNELRRGMYPVCVVDYIASGVANPVNTGQGQSGPFVQHVHFSIQNDGAGPAFNMDIKAEQGGVGLEHRVHPEWAARSISLQEVHRSSLAKGQRMECYFVFPAGASITQPGSSLRISVATDTIHQNRICFTYEAPMDILATAGEDYRKLRFCGVEELS